MNTSPAITSILPRLLRDRSYLLAMLLAPFFWFSLYYSGTAITGPDWLIHNLILFLQAALLYPLVEELVFRGLLQERLWQTRLSRMSIYCISLPNIVTSVVFTALHFLAHPPAWALAVIIPSLVFGFFRDRYQHVLPAIILHVFYNSGYFLFFGN